MDILSYKMIKDNKQVRENLFNHDWLNYRFIRFSGNILLQDRVDDFLMVIDGNKLRWDELRFEGMKKYSCNCTCYQDSIVVPWVYNEQIIDDAKYLGSDENNIYVKFGEAPGPFVSYKEFGDLKKAYFLNDYKIEREIPYFIRMNGENRNCPVYVINGERYIFFKPVLMDDYETDLGNISQEDIECGWAFGRKIEPLIWDIDRDNGIALARTNVCISNGFDDYENSKLKKFLNSDEFYNAIGVKKADDCSKRLVKSKD